jgi:hypothetical protein
VKIDDVNQIIFFIFEEYSVNFKKGKLKYKFLKKINGYYTSISIDGDSCKIKDCNRERINISARSTFETLLSKYRDIHTLNKWSMLRIRIIKV